MHEAEQSAVVIDMFVDIFGKRRPVLFATDRRDDVEMQMLDGADIEARVAETEHYTAISDPEALLAQRECLPDVAPVLRSDLARVREVALRHDEEHATRVLVGELVFENHPSGIFANQSNRHAVAATELVCAEWAKPHRLHDRTDHAAELLERAAAEKVR